MAGSDSHSGCCRSDNRPSFSASIQDYHSGQTIYAVTKALNRGGHLLTEMALSVCATGSELRARMALITPRKWLFQNAIRSSTYFNDDSQKHANKTRQTLINFIGLTLRDAANAMAN